jgi:hypothetical protein
MQVAWPFPGFERVDQAASRGASSAAADEARAASQALARFTMSLSEPSE